MLLQSSRGERFRDARKDAGFTMDDVADKKTGTGISKSMIQALEDDDSNRDVGYSNIAKLAAFYGVSADFLLGLSDVASPEISLQAIGKETGLSEKAIEKLKLYKKINGLKPINFLLEHPTLFNFIFSINKATNRLIDQGTSDAAADEKEMETKLESVREAASQLGGTILYDEEATNFYRQEAINALRDIVYDFITDRKKEG